MTKYKITIDCAVAPITQLTFDHSTGAAHMASMVGVSVPDDQSEFKVVSILDTDLYKACIVVMIRKCLS